MTLADELRDIALKLERGDIFTMTAARKMRSIADKVQELETANEAAIRAFTDPLRHPDYRAVFGPQRGYVAAPAGTGAAMPVISGPEAEE